MATTDLTRTFTVATADERKKHTYSAWIKLSTTGTFFANRPSNDYRFYYMILPSGHASEYQFYCYMVYNGSAMLEATGTKKFRDVNGWYHIVVRTDTTQGTGADRFRVYINGEQETLTFGHTPDQNEELQVNRDTTHYIGEEGNGNGQFSGYMSHIHFCDGQSYAPTEFGETDSNGVWTIKTSASVSYGTNGFFILKDGNSVTDQSGEGHNWAVNAGTLTDMQDCPDNVFATMNPLDNYEQGSTFTIGNNKVEWNTNNKTNYANFAINKGKYYWEMKYANNTGGSDAMIGISIEDNRQPDDYPGHDSTAWSYYASNGSKYNSGGSSYGDSWTTNDIIGVAFDADTRTLWFSKNGVWQNSATIAEIAAGTTTNAAWTNMGTAGNFFFPCMSGYDGNKAEFNFGNGYFSTTAITSEGTNASEVGKFEYDVPNNFTALSTKGLNI